MKCHDFDARVQQLLDDRRPLAGDGELTAHAMSCPQCEETLAAYETLLGGTRQLPRPALSNGFAARVVAEYRSGAVPVDSSRQVTAPGRWIVALAAIAALLVAAVTIGLLSNRVGNEGNLAAVESDEPSELKPPPGIVGIGVPGLAKGARSRDDLPSATAVTDAAPPSAVYPSGFSSQFGQSGAGYLDYRFAIESIAMQLPTAVERYESVEALTPGIRPIRESFSTALDTLRRTFPGQGETQHPRQPQALFMGGGGASLA